ncbi:hypothetical protein BKA62DRAFT_645507 [Auriculariales sp. MPI-PUGE-AT-0066]|nr:hypothetical protein BKA62DRAFT_645507 [Auriculariales sp. MPI-PUGE-AT-0066]
MPPSSSSGSSDSTPSTSKSRIPVTPAVLRSIFASSRSAMEERSISRTAFFRFSGFLLSCMAISYAARRNSQLALRGAAAGLLGIA